MMVQGLERANVGTYRLLEKRRKEERKKMKEKKINQRERKQECLEQQGKAREKGEFGKYFLPVCKRSQDTRDNTFEKATWIFDFGRENFNFMKERPLLLLRR